MTADELARYLIATQPKSSPKEEQLLSAVARKQAELTQRSQAMYESLSRNTQNEESLINQLGVDRDSFVGSTANLAAGAVEGGSKILSQLLTGIPSAINTAVDMAGYKDEAAAYRGGLERVRKAVEVEGLADTLNKDLFTYNLTRSPEGQQALNNWQQDKSVDSLTGLLTHGLSTLADNPAALGQFVAENIPQTALAFTNPAAFGSAMIGYAQENYDNWAKQVEAKTGQAPSTQDQTIALGKAYSLAAAEAASELVTKGLATGGLKASKPLAKLLDKAPMGVAPVSRAVGATALGGLGEVPTEMYQTYIEGDLGFKPATPEELYLAGTVGFGVGGSLAGVGATANELGVVSNAYVAKKAEEEAKYVEAVQKGDVSSFVNKKDILNSKWQEAANVLVAHANLEENKDKVEEIAAKYQTEVLAPLAKEVNDLKLRTTEGKQEIIGQQIAELKQELLTAPEEQKPALEADLANREAVLAKPVNTQIEKAAIDNLRKLEPVYAEVVSLGESFTPKLNELSTEQSIVGLAKTITEPAVVAASSEGTSTPVEASTEGVNTFKPVEQLIVRAMAAKGLSQAAIYELDKVSLTLGLPEELKTKVRTITAEAKALLAAKNVEEVSNDEIYGSLKKGNKSGENFMGIVEWKDRFDAATSETQKVKAYEGLKSFVEDRIAKGQGIASMNVGEFLIKKGPAKYETTTVKPKERPAFNTVSNLLGAEKTVAKINQALDIGVPIANALALRLNQPLPFVNVQETTQTKQAEEKRPEATGKGVTVSRTKQSKPAEPAAAPSVGVAEAQDANAGEGVTVTNQKQQQKEITPEQLVSEIEEEWDTKAQRLQNAERTVQEVSKQVVPTEAVVATTISNTESEQTAESQEDNGITEGSGSSSTTADGTGIEQVTEFKVVAVPESFLNLSRKELLIKLDKYQELATCLAGQ